MCSQKVACLPAADSHMLYAMAIRALSELVMIVIGKVFPLLLLPTLAMGQCANEMPSHRVSKGPNMVLSFGRRQKLSFLSQFFFIGSHLPHHTRIRLNKLHTQLKFKFNFTFFLKISRFWQI